MPYNLVPINLAGYFDTHIHSVNHGPNLMQAYSVNDVYALIDAAAQAKLTTICISDHMPFPAGVTDPSPDQDCAVPPARYDAVWQQLTTLQTYGKSKGVIVLWSGEYDVFPGRPLPQYKTNWKVLGQHFIDEVDGKPWCFDLSAESFALGITQLGITTVARRYFELLQSALVTNQFDSVAHLDLITKYNTTNAYFTEDNSYREYVAATLQLMQQRKVCLEINLGGSTATGHLVPQPWIIQAAVALGVAITIGSDEHAPTVIDTTRWQTTYAQLAKLGVTHLAVPILTH